MISENEYNEYCALNDIEKLEPFKVDNAVILAAGKSSRFLPFSNICPKGLCKIKNEVLIERQIKQLYEAGIQDILIVVGYKQEMFRYLASKYDVTLIENPYFDTQDNIASLELVAPYLGNTYICSVDNYYRDNIFSLYNYSGHYATVFCQGSTNEWCVTTDEEGYINHVEIGGSNSEIMMGYAYFDRNFSREFVKILHTIGQDSVYRHRVWEYVYMNHLDVLRLRRKLYDRGCILEFDSLADAIQFDKDFYTWNRCEEQ